MSKDTCIQTDKQRYTTSIFPKPLYEIEVDSLLFAHFSFSSLNMAHAIGVLDGLLQYLYICQRLKQERNIENRLEALEYYQKITQRINLASLEISSLTSELDCEEEKIAQIADFLSNKERDRETRLTATAIGIGALGTLFSGVLLNQNTQNTSEYIGLATGITEASLGAMILWNKQKVELSHPRNALKEIWEGKDSSWIFPPFIWYYLNYHNPEKTEEKSLRYQIIARWMSFKQIETVHSQKKRKLIGLYFGEGGKYTTDQLYNRANMYDQLESYIKLLKQDLTLLSIELENVK